MQQTHLLSYLPPLAMVVGLIFAIWGLHWLLIGRHATLATERRFPRQIILFALSIIGILVIILALPISDGARNRLLGLIGILISGIFAFSSTNILAGFMGGILLRITKPFHIGDFVRVGEHFGRVTESGLFDTEIQTENRELISLPNAYLIRNPIATTLGSGAIVSTTVSLGFDTHHGKIEELLLEAAERSGLQEPFVHILEIGNFSVSYRISGLLTETRRLITARSNLCRALLDTLHGEGIEILSPTYMNQRRMGDGDTTIPSDQAAPSQPDANGGEEVAFDKAEEAEQREQEKQRLNRRIKALEGLLKEASDDEKERIRKDIDRASKRFKELDQPQEEEDEKK